MPTIQGILNSGSSGLLTILKKMNNAIKKITNFNPQDTARCLGSKFLSGVSLFPNDPEKLMLPIRSCSLLPPPHQKQLPLQSPKTATNPVPERTVSSYMHKIKPEQGTDS